MASGSSGSVRGLLNPLAVDHQRRQVRFGEVAVVLAALLRALQDGTLAVFVPAHVHLLDHAAAVQHIGLALGLVGDGAAHGAQAVEVLHLDLGAELAAGGLLRRAHADIGLAAQRALLHVAAVDAQVAQDRAQLCQEGVGLVGAGDVGLGDDLHQGHSGPVQVDQRMQARVRVLARVLFQVGAVDADAFDAAVGQLDLDPAVAAEGQLVLGDLIALGQVRVVVVLAREDRGLRDFAVERQPRADRCFDRGAVAHRQRAGQTQADRAGVRIGRRALVVGAAAAEHLRLRQQLRVDFHAHDDVVFLFQLRRPLGEFVCFSLLIFTFRRGVANCVRSARLSVLESFLLWHLCWLLSVVMAFTWRGYDQH